MKRFFEKNLEPICVLVERFFEKNQKLIFWSIVAVSAFVLLLFSQKDGVKIISGAICFLIVSIYAYIYLIRLKPGSGEIFEYVSSSKKSKDDIKTDAKVEGKIPMNYFYSRVTSRKYDSENRVYVYQIEVWQSKEYQKTLSTV